MAIAKVAMFGKLRKFAANGGMMLYMGSLLGRSFAAGAGARLNRTRRRFGGRQAAETQALATYDQLAEAMASGDLTALDRIRAGAPGFPNSAEPHLGIPYFHIAVELGTPRTVEWMIAQGADLNAPDVNGSSPILCALQRDDDAEAVLRMLLVAGADPNAHASYADAPLSEAAAHAPVSLIRILLEFGADPGLSNGVADPDSPAERARLAGREDVVALMHQHATH